MRINREMNKQRKKKKIYIKIFLLVVIFAVSFMGGRFIAGFGSPDAPPLASGDGKDGELPVDRLNVLLLGIDARKGEKDARTDSMILVSIDRATKKIALVSIPRDTMVKIPGHGREKINSANIYGGVDLARETVENIMGVEIPYYVKTNFEGFKDIVDTLGGVTIDVEKRMVYRAEGIDLHPGMQRLDGYNALGYVRFRYDTLGDIARTERQQKFLQALAKEMLQAGSIVKLPKLAPQIMAAVDTNLSLSDMYFLTKVAANLDTQNMASATLPGVFYNARGSYWKVDEEKAKLVLNDLFSGVKVAAVEGSYSEPVKSVAHKPGVKKEKQAPVIEITGQTGKDGKQPDNGQGNDLQPPADGQLPPDGEQPPGSQLPPGGSNGLPPDQPGGTDPGGPNYNGQPVPPQGQPATPPANPPSGGQNGGAGSTPAVPQPPNSTGGTAPGTGGATPGAGGASGAGNAVPGVSGAGSTPVQQSGVPNVTG